jgi:hypothetical protein
MQGEYPKHEGHFLPDAPDNPEGEDDETKK